MTFTDVNYGHSWVLNELRLPLLLTFSGKVKGSELFKNHENKSHITWISTFFGLSFANWRKEITERLQEGYFSCLIYEMFGLENSWRVLEHLSKYLVLFTYQEIYLEILYQDF